MEGVVGKRPWIRGVVLEHFDVGSFPSTLNRARGNVESACRDPTLAQRREEVTHTATNVQDRPPRRCRYSVCEELRIQGPAFVPRIVPGRKCLEIGRSTPDFVDDLTRIQS